MIPSKIIDLGRTNVLELHGSYSIEQYSAALGLINTESNLNKQSGFKIEEDLIILQVNLNKTESDTQYEDYFVDSETFHWQGPGKTSHQSIISKVEQTSNIILFTRESKQYLDTIPMPFKFYGKLKLIDYDTNLPVNVNWRLEEPTNSQKSEIKINNC